MNLHITDLTKAYGAQKALDGLCLHLPQETRCLALIGPSGGGKSTLLRHLGGLEIPDSGNIEIDGKPLPTDESALRLYRQGNGFLFQSYNLFPHLTALRNITLPLEKVHTHTPQNATEIARQNLDRFGLTAHAHKFPAQLSGGQQQRVALIRAVCLQPQLLFLDEPTAALDPEMTFEVLELIRDLIRQGQPTILCTHEIGFAQAVADHIAFISRGAIVESGTPQDFFSQPKTHEAQRFLSRVLEFGWRRTSR